MVVGRLVSVTVVCPTVVVGYSSHETGVVVALGCPERGLGASRSVVSPRTAVTRVANAANGFNVMARFLSSVIPP
jgi:hypothetical protein